MRLLTRHSDNKLILHNFDDHDLPTYAILSHTWNPDNSQEVTYEDLESETWKGKEASYRKIEFCEAKANAAGLRYFWIDTCCINKRSESELSEAINSMFRWYQNSARCFVYLPDVSTTNTGQQQQQQPESWKEAFRRSRWFTRGWTLQELLAPKVVEFFAENGDRLGDKTSLETIICEVTGINAGALRGHSLSNFSVEERKSWAKHRTTKRLEDAIYSLLGIFEVSIPLIYGEGKENASRRLDDEVSRLSNGSRFGGFRIDLSHGKMPEAVQLVGREKEREDMRRILSHLEGRAIVVLHGLGGMGKTQLALDHINHCKAQYTAILWINASDYDTVRSSFVEIARQILEQHTTVSVLTGIDLEGNLDHVIDAVKIWLEISENKRWLLVYDNYDNPKIPSNSDPGALDIRQFLPESNHGAIIVTTRSSQVKIGQRIHIQKMAEIQDGLKILSNVSGRSGIETDPGAIALVEELDGLPLALATAGAYLEHMATSFSDYLRLYRASWLELQRSSPQLESYDRSLYTTWQVSFEQIEQRNPFSAMLLRFWAYFDRQDIWFELIRRGRSAGFDWLDGLANELSFNDAVRLLCNYGLVDAEPSSPNQVEGGGYSIHACVHAWTVSVLNKRWDKTMAILALTCIAKAVPHTDTDKSWLLQRRLLQHAARCQSFIENGRLEVKEAHWILHSLGYLFEKQGKQGNAEMMYLRALRAKEEALGPLHTSTLDTVNNLGILYSDQGKLSQAKLMYLRALQGREVALGPMHMSTLETVNNLGLLYSNEGKLEEAKVMYLRAIQGKEKALGLMHMSTLSTVNNLGILYRDQGNLDGAEKMFLRALQGREEALGPSDILTLDVVNNLGILYTDQGKLSEAERMFLRALQREETLGSMHTLILDTIHNLGSVYRTEGKLDKAKTMYLRALQGKEEELGLMHKSTLSTVNNLGLLYHGQGKLDEAETMYLQALQGYQDALGPTHISTLYIFNNLGDLYASQRKHEEAEGMYSRAIQGSEEVNRLMQISTPNTANDDPGTLYADQGKMKETLEPRRELTLNSLHSLANLYKVRQKYQLAENKYSMVISGYENALGKRHPRTLMVVSNLGLLYADQGKREEAEAMYMRVQQGYEEALSLKDRLAHYMTNSLGSLLCRRCMLWTSVKTFDDAMQVRVVTNHTTFLKYFHQLVRLCAGYPEARYFLLSRLGRVLLWIGNRRERPLQAFGYQLAITKQLYHAFCDGCNQDLSIISGRSVCMVCEDIDLCAKCHASLRNGEIPPGVQSCAKHAWLEVSKDEAELKLGHVEDWLGCLAGTNFEKGHNIE